MLVLFAGWSVTDSIYRLKLTRDDCPLMPYVEKHILEVEMLKTTNSVYPEAYEATLSEPSLGISF